MPLTLTPDARRELTWFLRQAKAPRLRPVRQFAEEEIILPSGPFEGRRFTCARQPYAGLWFDAIDSGRWNRHAAVGPTQTGKTLHAWSIPILYHLFEVGERVVAGLPDMDMAADKWRDDLLPVIERTRYRDLLPTRGAGSRGGTFRSITFRNGATLRFMSGGGGDKSRAGFTARVVAVTEADGLDMPGTTSRETDKLGQIEARTRAYGDRKRIYLECTASIEEGRIWQEYTKGTQTAIALRCPHCRAWVSPEREHLAGWQEAEDEVAAKKEAHFCCPACGVAWSETDRRRAHDQALAVHRGQEVTPAGTITGQPPRTHTLAFRWSAVNNCFAAAGDVGVKEWRAVRAVDEDTAERELLQFDWAMPAKPPETDETPLDTRELVKRRDKWAKGFLPSDTLFLTMGVDLGKRFGSYLLLAFRASREIHFADYGRFDVPSDDFDVELAILKALRDLRDLIARGWPMDGRSAPRIPDQVWIDASYQPSEDGKGSEVVYNFVRESGRGLKNRFKAVIGRGASQRRHSMAYTRPRQTGRSVRKIGNGWHVARRDRPGDLVVFLDVDQWKSWVHHRLATPTGKPGAATFYAGTDREHITLAKHLTAERQRTEFVAGRGVVTRWETVSRANHYLDCTTYATGAGDYCGFQLGRIEPETVPTSPTPEAAGEAPTAGNTERSWFAQQQRRKGPRR